MNTHCFLKSNKCHLPCQSLAFLKPAQSSCQFEPEFTVFVSKVWPSCADPKRYFTSIQEAINVAVTLGSPNIRGPLVVVYPGIYDEVLSITSSIEIISAGTGRSVIISGFTCTFSGTNIIAITLNGFTVGGNFMADFTGYQGPLGLLEVKDSFGINAIMNGSSTNGSTEFLLTSSDLDGSVLSQNLGFIVINDSTIAGNIDISSIYAGLVSIESRQVIGSISVIGPINAAFLLHSVVALSNITVSGGIAAFFAGSKVFGTTTAVSPSIIDTLSSDWTALAGNGSIDRSIYMIPDITVDGLLTQVISLVVPYIDNTYNVVLTPSNAQAIDHNPAIIAKTTTNFTVQFAVGTPTNATFSVTILQSSTTAVAAAKAMTTRPLHLSKLLKEKSIPIKKE